MSLKQFTHFSKMIEHFMNKVYIIVYLKCRPVRNVIIFCFVNQILVREMMAILCDSYPTTTSPKTY